MSSPHLLGEVAQPALVELDEDDLYDLLSEAYFMCVKMAERRNPKRLQSDLLSLIARLEPAISWQVVM